MTRAKETLTILVRKDRRTIFADEISGTDILVRTPREMECRTLDTDCRRYGIVEPADLFISYAASMPENSPVHAEIRKTQVGDRVALVVRGKWIHVETAAGAPISTLSEAGRGKWAPRLENVRSATVTAMVRRTIEQEIEPYRAKAQVAAWEYPVLEVCWDER
jgi:ATP-dependent DNA helicase RecQ